MNAIPPDAAAPQTQRFHTLSRRMGWVCWALAVALVLMWAWAWAWQPTDGVLQQVLGNGVQACDSAQGVSLSLRYRDAAGDAAGGIARPLPQDLATWQRALGALVDAVPLVLVLLALRCMGSVFGRFARGEVFSVQVMHQVRAFASYLLAAGVLQVVAKAINSMVLTWTNPPGKKLLQISVSSDFGLLLVITAALWLLAHVIGQGYALAQENEAFV